MDKNQTENIIKDYEKKEKNFVKTEKNTDYLNKMKEIKDVEIELNKMLLHIERLEMEKNNISDFQVKDECDRQIKETKKEMETRKTELENLKQEKENLLVEKRKNEKVLRENICKEVNELQDKTRKELMTQKKEIDTEIAKKKMELEVKKFELSQFNYKYDENGVPINGHEFKKMQDDQQTLFSDIKELENLSLKCEEYREKLIDPFKMPPELPDDEVYVDFQKETQKDSFENDNVKKTTEVDKENADIIKGIKSEMAENERNYKDIHLEPQPIISENPLNESKQLNENEGKTNNVFENNNIINSAKEEMEQENRNYKNIHLQDENILKQVPKVSGLKSKVFDRIEYIEINEKDEKVYYKDSTGEEQEISTNIAKKELFKDLKIADICEEIAGAVFPGLLLKRKVNPNIVSVLKDNPEQLREYIKNLREKKNLPFELVHNLEGINLWKKFRLNKFVKIEEKLGAKVLGKLFDKNRTLKEGETLEKKSTKNVIDKQKEVNEVNDKIQKGKEEVLENNKYGNVTDNELKKTGKVTMDTKYKIDNEGNIIEKVAKDKYEKISEEEQVKRAEEVKKMMNDKQNDR